MSIALWRGLRSTVALLAWTLLLGLSSEGRVRAAEPPAAEPAPAPPSAAAVRPAPELGWLRQVYEQSVDSVVLIEAEERTGSGFCFAEPQYVLTALHVVADAGEVVVKSSLGGRSKARVVSYSEAYDLALLRLEQDDLALVPLAVERSASIGEPVAVVGHPFAQLARSEPRLRGLLEWSLSAGIVGAVSGSWLQTDAALNPGVSGGPVLNRAGQVIGVVSARLNDAQNIGMITRIGRAFELLEHLDRGGPPRRWFALDAVELGVVAQWGESTLTGVMAGVGLRLLEDIVIGVRAGLLEGPAQPTESTVLVSNLRRVLAEGSAGYGWKLSQQLGVTLELGVAVARERRTDASLRATSAPSCATPPCLITGEVVRSTSHRYPAWPMAVASLGFGPLRARYALQIDSTLQHQFIAAFAF
jgi:trypsin-like peptidase